MMAYIKMAYLAEQSCVITSTIIPPRISTEICTYGFERSGAPELQYADMLFDCFALCFLRCVVAASYADLWTTRR